MKIKFLILTVLFALINSVEAQVKTGDIPDKKPVTSLPPIVGAANEVLIASSFIDVDPSIVLGAIVDLQAKEVLSLESFLKPDAKPVDDIKTEMKFRNIVEKNVAANASYLGFVEASLSDDKKAEITLIKNRVRSATLGDLKMDDLKKKIAALPAKDGARYGIIVAYTDYLLTASFFRKAEKKAEASGYGAKLGGRWFNKEEGLSVERSVVATYAPLSLLPSVADATSEKTPLKDLIKPSLPSLPPIEKLNMSNR